MSIDDGWSAYGETRTAFIKGRRLTFREADVLVAIDLRDEEINKLRGEIRDGILEAHDDEMERADLAEAEVAELRDRENSARDEVRDLRVLAFCAQESWKDWRAKAREMAKVARYYRAQAELWQRHWCAENENLDRVIASFYGKPTGDTLHITDGGPCWCEPETKEVEGGTVVIHRDIKEEGH